MKAPDKIYIHRTIHLGLLSASEIVITGQDEQYIRKDALLEWLDGKLTIEGATEGYVGGYDSALKDVINKIESL